MPISLQGVSKNKETSIHSFDISEFQNYFLNEDRGSWKMKFPSKYNVAEWLSTQDQDLFKRLNQSYEMQLLILERKKGRQFGKTFLSDLTLETGIKGVSLIFQHDDSEIKEHLAMSGKLTVSMRAYKQGTKILHENFLGLLQLKDPLIASIWKSKDAGRPAIIDFQCLEPEFSDQLFFEDFSKIASWLCLQNNQIFIDLKVKGVNVDIFIGGRLNSSCYRFAIPSNFLLACGEKGLSIDLCIND